MFKPIQMIFRAYPNERYVPILQFLDSDPDSKIKYSILNLNTISIPPPHKKKN